MLNLVASDTGEGPRSIQQFRLHRPARAWLKRVRMLLVMALLLAGCAASTTVPTSSATRVPPTSSAETSPASSTARCEVQAADGLRLRRGPSTDNEIMDTLPQGTPVTPLARTAGDQWMLVNVPSRASTLR